MYKSRNTGTESEIPGTRGIGGMLNSREYRQTMESGEGEKCLQKFRGMSPNIPENVVKHSRECRKTNIRKHSRISCNTSFGKYKAFR